MAKAVIRRYTEALYDTWEQYIDRSLNGTIFHRLKFINYHPEGRFDNYHLLFYEKDKILALFPAALVDKGGAKVLKSHPGTSYGGLVFATKIPLRKVFEILELLESHCRENGIQRIEFRMAPKIFNRALLDQVDFSLVRCGYQREDEELATFYPLADFEEQPDFKTFGQEFPTTSRKAIKKGIRENLTARVLAGEKEIEAYYGILQKNLRDRFDKAPTHALGELQWLVKNFKGKIFVYGVFHQSELAGGYTVFEIAPGRFHIFYACIHYDFQLYRPANFALAHLIYYLQQNGAAVLNYGISTEDGGRHINWGLFRFKEDFGGTGVLRTYWLKDLSQ